MKLMKRMLRVFRKESIGREAGRRSTAAYYDNYTMLGTVLGGYCGMLKRGGRKE